MSVKKRAVPFSTTYASLNKINFSQYKIETKANKNKQDPVLLPNEGNSRRKKRRREEEEKKKKSKRRQICFVF